MTAVGGVSIIAKYDDKTTSAITDNNGVANLKSLPKNKDVYIQLLKDRYRPINMLIKNTASTSPRSIKITLTDIDTGQILYTETIQILPDQEVPFDYQIEGYQRIAGSITVKQT
jgi:hypothetical protein